MKLKRFLAAAMIGMLAFSTVSVAVPTATVMAALPALADGDRAVIRSMITSTIKSVVIKSTSTADSVKADITEAVKAALEKEYDLSAATFFYTVTGDAEKGFTVSTTVSPAKGSSFSLDDVTLKQTGYSTTLTMDVNYEAMTATITSSDKAMYVFLDVLKDEQASKISGTYAYATDSEGKAVIDLSFLKVKGDCYIRAYSNTEALPTAIVTVKKQPDKLKIKFVAGAAEVGKAFTVSEGKTAVSAEDVAKNIEADKYQYKTLYGSKWYSLADWNMSAATVAGTTLIIRTAPVDNNDAAKDAMASAEVKVKIAAQAKAPKVKVDYVKGTIAMTEKLQYNVLVDNELKAKDWVAGKKENMEPAAILAECGITEADAQVKILNEGFMLVVRTAANGTKAASQAAFVKVLPQISLTYTEGAESLVVKKDEITLTWTTEENGIKFVAKGANFEYKDAEKKTWITIKEGEKGALYKLTDVTEANIAEVRVAGVKESKTAVAAMPSLSVMINAKAYVDPDDTDITTAEAIVASWITDVYTPSNDDSNDTIKTAVENAIKSVDGITVKVEVTVSEATTEGAGSVKGKITLTKGDASTLLEVNKTIAQLSQ